MAMGSGCALLNLFTSKDVSAIRRLLALAAVPAALFRMIGDASFGLPLFIPLFNAPSPSLHAPSLPPADASRFSSFHSVPPDPITSS
jgi:hypothetical protein